MARASRDFFSPLLALMAPLEHPQHVFIMRRHSTFALNIQVFDIQCTTERIELSVQKATWILLGFGKNMLPKIKQYSPHFAAESMQGSSKVLLVK